MLLIIVFTNIIVIEKKFDNLSFKSKHFFLKGFFDEFFFNLDKLNNVNPKKSTKKKKINVYDKASELYNNCLGIYYHKYYELSDDKRKTIESKYDPKDLFLDYSMWSENEEKATDKEEVEHLPPMPPLEGDKEEVKEGKGLRFLTQNKLLTRLPILLPQIKAGNSSYKLKNEIRQILYFLHQHNKITKTVYNNLIKLL